MRTCGLVTAGECGSRLNAVRNGYEKKESGNRQSGPGLMSNKELVRRETPLVSHGKSGFGCGDSSWLQLW
jgi:hypothetical protein